MGKMGKTEGAALNEQAGEGVQDEREQAHDGHSKQWDPHVMSFRRW